MGNLNDLINQIPQMPKQPKPVNQVQDATSQSIGQVLRFIANELPIKKDLAQSQELHKRLSELIGSLEDLVSRNDTAKFTKDVVEGIASLVSKLDSPIVNIDFPKDEINAVTKAVESLKFEQAESVSVDNLSEVTKAIQDLKPFLVNLEAAIEDKQGVEVVSVSNIADFKTKVEFPPEMMEYLKHLERLATTADRPLAVRLTDGKAYYKAIAGAISQGINAVALNSNNSFFDSNGVPTKANLDSSGNLEVNIVAGGAGNGAILDGVDSAIKATVTDLANSNPLAVSIVDGAGTQITSFGGGTQYTEDAIAAANPVGTAVNLVRQDTPAGLVSTDGDNVAQRGTNYGAAYTQIVTSAGAFVDTFGGGTQYTEDVAAAADPIGTMGMAVRADTPAAVTSTDGDNIAFRATNKGELYVKQTDVVPVSDNAGSLTVDNPTLSVVGGGVEAAALRVTIASDSTGVLSVDDNGGSLTIDGTVTANLAAGTNNIGDVDILSIAAGDNNIGNVDIVSSALPTGASTLAEQQTQTTALQLIDDTVYTDGVGTVVKGIAILGQDGTNPQAIKTDAAGELQIDIVTSALPTGAATSALQTQPGVDIGDVTVNNAAGASAVNIQDGGNSITVDGTFFQATQPVSAATLPLPTGASTLAEQQTQTTALQLIDDAIYASDAVLSKTMGIAAVLDDVATVAITENQAGYLRMSSRRALLVEGVASGTAIPISAASLPLPAGAATSALQTQPGVDIGDVTVNNAAGASAVNIQDGGNSITIDGTVSVTGVATETTLASILTSSQLIDDTIATLGTDTYTEAVTKGQIIGAVRRDADTTLVSLTNEIAPLQVDANGRLKVEVFSGETLPVSLTSTTITGTVAATQSGTWTEANSAAILTSTQLIDDTIVVMGTDVYTEAASKGQNITAVRRDADTTLVSLTNEYGPLQMDANGRLKVEVFDGGDSHTVDNAGTFVVQENGAALTALQLIDNAVSGTGFNISQVNGEAVDVGAGTEAAAIRVTLPTNGTGVIAGVTTVTTVSTVTNQSQEGGVAISLNAGAVDTGTRRVVQANGAGKTILSTGGSASVSGNNTLVAAGTNRLKVKAFSLTTTSTTAMTCIFQSGAAGTELWRVIIQAPTGANAGANLSTAAPDWLFATASATLLNLNLSSANAVHWSVSYYDEV